MMILLTIIHVLVCVFLVIVVLLQSGKAADLAGAFGGMGSQTAFGPRGAATVLSKATTIAAGLFMVTSLDLGDPCNEKRRYRFVRSRTAKAANDDRRRALLLHRVNRAPARLRQGLLRQFPPPGGQPSVTLDYGGGNTKTMPLDLNKLPKVDPNAPPARPRRRQRQRKSSTELATTLRRWRNWQTH